MKFQVGETVLLNENVVTNEHTSMCTTGLHPYVGQEVLITKIIQDTHNDELYRIQLSEDKDWRWGWDVSEHALTRINK